MKQDKFISYIQQITLNLLEKLGFLVHEWHLGKVSEINENGTLNVYIDGSTTVTPSVPCNPDIIFAVDDYVWVHYVNRNSQNLFIPYKRNIISQ